MDLFEFNIGDTVGITKSGKNQLDFSHRQYGFGYNLRIYLKKARWAGLGVT